jgi:hypothetical protein
VEEAKEEDVEDSQAESATEEDSDSNFKTPLLIRYKVRKKI